MNISSAPAQASAVLAAYTEKMRGMQCQLAVLRTRQRRTLAAVIAGVILCAALLIVGIHGPKAIHVAMAVALIGTIWASQDFLGSRKSSVELARLSGFYERGIERLEDDWRGKGSTGREYALDKHLYQADLDILGEGSLFELLCTTRSSVGAERLDRKSTRLNSSHLG